MNKASFLVLLVGLSFTVKKLEANFGCFFGAPENQETIRGSGKQLKEDRQVRSFNEIEAAGLGLVILSQGEKNSLTVESDDNILPYLTSEVSGNKLVIKPKPNVNLQPTGSIKYYVTFRDIKSLAVAGSVALQSEGIETDELSISAAGSTDIRATIKAKLLSLSVAGSSNIKLDGSVEKQILSLAGSVRYHAKRLASKLCTISAAGSVIAEVQASNELDGTISGSGRLSYAGNPEAVEVKTFGSATVKKTS